MESMICSHLGVIVLAIGSSVFMIAAFMPPTQIYAAPDAATRIEILNKHTGLWVIHSILFASSMYVIAAGMGLFIPNYSAGLPRNLGMAASITCAIAVLCWLPIAVSRLRLNTILTTGDLGGPAGFFLAYTAFSILSFLLFGAAVLLSGYPAWMGIVGIALPILTLVFGVVMKDVPPFFHYLGPLIISLTLVIQNR